MKMQMEDGSIREIVMSKSRWAFYLRRDGWVIQFVLGVRRVNVDGYLELYPVDVGYHSPVPTYEGQKVFSEDCGIIGGRCYYDGTSLGAEELLSRLSANGVDAVWDELEQWYRIRRREADELTQELV